MKELKLTIKMPDEMYDTIKKIAVTRFQPVDYFVLMLIYQYLKHNKLISNKVDEKMASILHVDGGMDYDENEENDDKEPEISIPVEEKRPEQKLDLQDKYYSEQSGVLPFLDLAKEVDTIIKSTDPEKFNRAKKLLAVNGYAPTNETIFNIQRIFKAYQSDKSVSYIIAELDSKTMTIDEAVRIIEENNEKEEDIEVPDEHVDVKEGREEKEDINPAKDVQSTIIDALTGSVAAEIPNKEQKEEQKEPEESDVAKPEEKNKDDNSKSSDKRKQVESLYKKLAERIKKV